MNKNNFKIRTESNNIKLHILYKIIKNSIIVTDQLDKGMIICKIMDIL